MLHEGYPFVYTRGGTHLVVVNPRRAPATAPLPPGLAVRDALEVAGVVVESGDVKADGFGYGIFELG